MILYDNNERLLDNLNLNFRNRSRIYLWNASRLLKTHSILTTQDIVAFGCGFETPEGLLIACKTSNYSKIERLIDLLKSNDEYLNDRIITADIHGILIQIPVNIEAFVKGQYSQIYAKEQIDQCFNSSDAASKVLKQDITWFPKFFEQMWNNFNVYGSEHIPPNLSEELFKNYTEYDISPCLGQEVLFYKSN